MRIILFVIMFFIIGALFLISNNELSMHDKADASLFWQMYIEWFKQIFSNSKNLSGNVVKLTWLPTNISSDNFNYNSS